VELTQKLLSERFLILEIDRESVTGAIVALDREKRLSIEKVIPSEPWGATVKGGVSLRGMSRLSLRAPTPIVGCDSSLAYTALIPVHFIRERIREPLGQVELENLLAQAIGKNINQSRKDASIALAVDELDVVLAKSRVVNFKLDDHEVLNPLGFRAQKIEALVELTLTTRPAYEEAKRITGSSEMFFTETAHAELSMLEKIAESPVRLLRLRPEHSSFFTREDSQIGYTVVRGELGWTVNCFEKTIREAWGVSGHTARTIYQDELAGMHADVTSKFLAKLIKMCTQLFTKEVEGSGLKGKVFVDSSIPLPFEMPAKKRTMTLTELPLETILEKFGFSFKEGGEIAASAVTVPLTSLLAPFFENFYDRGTGVLNQWLRRHLHWLGATLDKNDIIQ
jgi:hypothetical protein